MATDRTAAGAVVRRRDAEATKADLLAVATKEFARAGFSGARVDAIAEKTRTTKRMIYYYFGGKAGLYTAVLEEQYAAVRRAEQALSLDELAPVDAMRAVIEFGVDYHHAHPDFSRLVAIENIHGAKHLATSERQAALNRPIVDLIEGVLERGRASGDFVREATALEVHLMTMAWAVFSVTNAPTVKVTFGLDMRSADAAPRVRAMIVDAVLAWLRTTD